MTGDQRLAHRREGGHWLMFADDDSAVGPVRGCACGFIADLDADAGWGDSVVDHLESVIRAERADVLRDDD